MFCSSMFNIQLVVQKSKVRYLYCRYTCCNHLHTFRLVKLTSPYVNVMIIAGAVIFYITVILFGVDENVASFSTVDHLCQTKIWLVAIGFSLLFGSIFAKTWRIYYIFNVAKPNSKFVSVV